MSHFDQLPLGRQVAYPQHYNPRLLVPISRFQARADLGITATLPFAGYDRWHLYELSWLNEQGLPQVATATIEVPCDSTHLIESKSLKLYLNSLNGHRLSHANALRDCLIDDLSRVARAPVTIAFGVPVPELHTAQSLIDDQNLTIDHYGPPQPDFLACDDTNIVTETLQSAVFKSNCPVTGQPDWASVEIHYQGPQIDRAGLLRYLVSFRNHAQFHEHCVEHIFQALQTRCQPSWLGVMARYTRRGGVDINPVRYSPHCPWLGSVARDIRQ